MSVMQKFPSIEQFRNVIRHVADKTRYAGKDENGSPIYDYDRVLPTLKFKGTVKLHGTNAGIVYTAATEQIHYQSRERVLSLAQDNAGFMLAMSKHEDLFMSFFKIMNAFLRNIVTIALYGEYCGGNIQKGVAISGLPRMFVIFGTKVTYEDGTVRWIEGDSNSFVADDVFDIEQFPFYQIEIDFNHPELVQNELIALTDKVEAECPVGKHFGQIGTGEGIVWKCVTPGWEHSTNTWFKVKGTLHSNSKVKTLTEVDVESAKTLIDFVENVVTEARLEQGLDNLVREQLKPFEMSSLGDFIRWVFNDVIKEENDTVIAAQIDPKKLGGPIANKARPWYIKRFNEKA